MDTASTDTPVIVSGWRDHAACKGHLDLFFPKYAERPQARARREARAAALCATCSVASTCRLWARTHAEYGFWGGENEAVRYADGVRVSAPIGVPGRR